MEKLAFNNMNSGFLEDQEEEDEEEKFKAIYLYPDTNVKWWVKIKVNSQEILLTLFFITFLDHMFPTQLIFSLR